MYIYFLEVKWLVQEDGGANKMKIWIGKNGLSNGMLILRELHYIIEGLEVKEVQDFLYLSNDLSFFR